MKIVFMGTPDFAVPELKRLIEDGHQIVGVFTQPDKPKGRKQVLTPPPVKELALTHGLPVFQPQTLRDGAALALLKELVPQLIVVVAYGKILPEAILNLPEKGCLNIHGSLLPRYRGAAPIQWSVLNGDKITGVTAMLMDVGVDTGDMLKSLQTEIGENETAQALYGRLAELGASLLSETVADIAAGRIERTPQDHRLATSAPMLSREMSPIDWYKSAAAVHNQVRGLFPWPAASTSLDGKCLKIHRTTLAGPGKGEPGTVASEAPLRVVCGDGNTVEIHEVQYEGGKRMDAGAFLRGHPIPLGKRLGE